MTSDFNCHETWDAVIIGAGPAGSITAALLAERGWNVLLLERKAWPREKACGGCLNAVAIRLLRASGLGSALEGATPIHRLEVRLGNRHLSVSTPPGLAIDRKTFDGRLVEQAISRGAFFVDRAKATLLPRRSRSFREVSIEHDNRIAIVHAPLVLACDGIQGSSLRDEAWAKWQTAENAAIGLSTTVTDDSIPAGTITMCVGSGGYVGLVRQGETTVHVGAALHLESCISGGSPALLTQRILIENGISLQFNKKLTGIGPMTRQREVAGEGILAVGDACGYVEPFTGEGIAWAIRGACSLAHLLTQSGPAWTEDLALAWKTAYANEVARRQGWCKMLQALTRMPTAAAACMQLGKWFPSIPQRVAERIGG